MRVIFIRGLIVAAVVVWLGPWPAPLALARGLSGYAWSDNIGWVKFAGPGYSSAIDDVTDRLSGYAWSSNIGWIKFGFANGPNNLSGHWARACAGAGNADCSGGVSSRAGNWDGWISLSGNNFDVVRDTNRCQLNGWAWGSEVVGWLKFSGPGYAVRLSDCHPEEVKPLPRCDFTAAPTTVAKGGHSRLSWDCHATADSCVLPQVTISNGPPAGTVATGVLTHTTAFNLTCANSSGNVTFTATVNVVRPKYCEVIPFIGSCR